MGIQDCARCGLELQSGAPVAAAVPGPPPDGAPRGVPVAPDLARGHVLLVGTGAFGVSTLPSWALLLRAWYGWSTRALLTWSAARLVAPAAVAAGTGAPVAGPGWDTGSGVPHQELAEWADLVLVAPATATFVAKAALGMPDSLALAVTVATAGDVVVVPSLAERALARPSVGRNLALLAEEGYHVVGPRPGLSAHTAQRTSGAMADIATTLRAVWHVRRCLVTGHPDDPSNPRPPLARPAAPAAEHVAAVAG